MIKGNGSLSRQQPCFLDGMKEQYIYLFSPRKNCFFIEKINHNTGGLFQQTSVILATVSSK